MPNRCVRLSYALQSLEESINYPANRAGYAWVSVCALRLVDTE